MAVQIILKLNSRFISFARFMFSQTVFCLLIPRNRANRSFKYAYIHKTFRLYCRTYGASLSPHVPLSCHLFKRFIHNINGNFLIYFICKVLACDRVIYARLFGRPNHRKECSSRQPVGSITFSILILLARTRTIYEEDEARRI